MELPTSTFNNKDLERKIATVFGNNHRQHLSQIDQSPNTPCLLFSRPGRRGFFTINNLAPYHRFETFEVFCESIPLGRMTYNDICIKFGRR